MDHLLVLCTIIHNRKRQKLSTYACFIDSLKRLSPLNTIYYGLSCYTMALKGDFTTFCDLYTARYSVTYEYPDKAIQTGSTSYVASGKRSIYHTIRYIQTLHLIWNIYFLNVTFCLEPCNSRAELHAVVMLKLFLCVTNHIIDHATQ